VYSNTYDEGCISKIWRCVLLVIKSRVLSRKGDMYAIYDVLYIAMIRGFIILFIMSCV
jgi:hypothetical protein